MEIASVRRKRASRGVANDDDKETVAKVNSLTILLARLSRLCRKDEAQGAEGEV